MKNSSFYLFFKKPLVAGVTTFMLMFVITQYIAYQRFLLNENEQKKEINNHINLIKEKLQSLVINSHSSLKALEYLVERNGVPEDFESIAIELLEHNKYFDVVQLVDRDGYITHVYPLKDNEVIGFNIFTSDEAKSGALETLQRKEFYISGPINLKQGGVAMISRTPMFRDDEFIGFSAVITRLSTFFNDLEIDTKNDKHYIYQLSRVNLTTGKEDFFLDNDISKFNAFAVPIEMDAGEWKLYIAPIKVPFNKAYYTAIIGLLFSMLLSWIVWYYFGQSERVNKLINNKLIEQEAQLKSIHENTSKQISESELLYRTLTSNAPVSIFNTNTIGECTYVNEEWLKYSGMEYQEAMGMGWQNALHPEDKDRILKEWQESVIAGSDFNSELRFIDKSGNITYLTAKATKLIDENNNVMGYVGMATDITDRINYEKELVLFKNDLEKIIDLRTSELKDSQNALLNLVEDINAQSIELAKEKEKAESADLMKSAFLATMSHELRTPMNSIIGFTSILLKEYAGPLNEEQKKQMLMVRNSGQHLLRLINDILDISKIEAGELVISIITFDYIETMNKSIEFMLPQASNKNLSIILNCKQNQILLKSDQRRVEQIILNLISNAIKFSDNGIINVNIKIKDNYVYTDVVDQGIGISKEDLKKLFKPFVQVKGGLSRSHEGTGLGLAISKNLVEKLGGKISAKSTLKKGSTFSFTLPLNQ